MRHLRAIVNLIAIGLIVLATIRLWDRRNSVPPEAIDSPSILDRRVGALEFHDLAFDDAVERLSRAAGVEIVIDTTDPVMQTVLSTGSFSLKTWEGMTLNSALAALLPTPNQSEMRYFVNRGHVRITMWPKIPVVTRIYDVRDLERWALDDVTARIPEHEVVVGGGIAGGLGPATTLPSAALEREQAIEAGAMDRVVNLVMYSIPGSDEYNVNGGRAAELWVVDGRLIVTHTAEGHRRISQLLGVVRQVLAIPNDGRGN